MNIRHAIQHCISMKELMPVAGGMNLRYRRYAASENTPNTASDYLAHHLAV